MIEYAAAAAAVCCRVHWETLCMREDGLNSLFQLLYHSMLEFQNALC